ncbi:hypothetical protein CPB86DRAFT_876697 [Serendipita vermifera]|nr:hypothetical protein CPB86DRAFT_876697 [Serendipita vermifera]
MFNAAKGASAVLASQSVYFKNQHSANVSALGELSRLSKAGMTMLASSAQLSVNGFLNISTGAASFETPDHPASICNRIIMESSTITTVPVLPYALFTGFSILIIAISYAGSLPLAGKSLFSSLMRYHDTWTLHLPGQLHKEMTESLNGKEFKFVDVDSPWPNAPFASGPVITTHHGINHFESGGRSSLHGMSEGNQDQMLSEPLRIYKHNDEI